MVLHLPTRITPLFVILLSLLSAGCGGGVSLPIAPGDPNKPPPNQLASFAEDIEPVLTSSSCAASSCHGTTEPSLSLTLKKGEVYARLVDVKSKQFKDFALITPGDPDNSYLVKKLEGTSPRGDRMPNSGPSLDPNYIAALRQWIAAGAPNN